MENLGLSAQEASEAALDYMEDRFELALVEIGSKQAQNPDIILIIATARRPG